MVVFGASGHAKVIIDILTRSSNFEIVGLIDSNKPAETFHCGYRVLGNERTLKGLMRDFEFNKGVVGVGDNFTRSELVRRIVSGAPNFQFISAIHSSAVIADDVAINPGTVVMAGAIINPGSRIGRHCIVNTRASIDHDCVLEDFCSIAPGATLGGGVLIGGFSAIGLGASVIHGRSIGQHSILGAGATLTRNLPEFQVAYGVPAHPVRMRTVGERYL